MDGTHDIDAERAFERRFGATLDLGEEAAAIDDPADASSAGPDEQADSGVGEALFDLGGDERRMHVRAYNHWVSLLKGRPYPSIEDLDPASIADFGAHSVLLDFGAGMDDPAIAYLGRALRDECGLAASPARISAVPGRSLLSRLTDHYLQIIANCAPIGFEAEFVNTRGRNTLYRGILTPFSSDGDRIDFIYGVINWKETVDAATQASLDAELAAARGVAPPPPPAAPTATAIWADGPGAAFAEAPPEVLAGSLADHLMLARESAAAVEAADGRSRAALYRALGRAHDFALAADEDAAAYEALLAEAAIAVQARAPMTPVVKLVFGAGYDKTRLAEFAAVLQHARRHAIGAGALPAFVESFAGGIKAVVAAERSARRPAARPDAVASAMASARALPSLAHVAIAAPAAAEFVVLLARASADGGVEVIAQVETPAIVESCVRRAVG